MNLPWFRLYAEFAGDPVIQSLAFEDQRHYIILLCLKCAGVLDRSISKPSRDRVILRALGLDPSTGAEVKRRLVEVSLVTETWGIPGWNKRQFDSDSSAARTRKYRERLKSGTVTVTPEKRHGDAPDQDTDSDMNTTDLKKQDPPYSCPEPFANGANAHGPNGSKIFLKTCKMGVDWEVPEAKIAEWEESYPDVDVKLTLLGIRQWLIDNPSRRKTRQGMARFVNSWMMREQDKPEPRQYAKTTHH